MSLSNNFPTIKPSLLLDFANTKALDPRITFTRSTTATYYDGVTTAKAEENLLTYSEQFDNAIWLTGGTCTVTANSTAAPDGTTTADTITDNTANSYHGAYNNSVNTFSSQAVTASVYLKAGTNQYGYLGIYDGTNYNGVVADLTGGTITSTTGTLTSSSITSVGNGWYRVVITKTITATTYLLVGLSNAATPTFTSGRPAYVGTGTTIFAWGAQLEQRSSVTAYTATTTQPITNYIPVLQTAASGVPRFDHNPTTDESLGLLIEEQRTNLFTYSAQLDNAAWTKTNVTITADTIVAPDGTLTGDKVVENTAAGFHYVRQNISVSATAYTISFFAKAAERSFVWATLDGGSNQGWFNLSAGTTGLNGGGSTQITSVGNGWYRCSYTATLSAGTAPCFIYLATSTSTASYTGDGFSGAYIWGAQLEAGSFATSYIPTVASTVTRNADNASMTGTNFSSWFSAPEGTLYAEAYLVTGTTLMGISDGSTSNRIQLSMGSSGNQFLYIVGGVIQALFAGPASTTNAFNKVIFGYKTNDFAGTVNAGAVTTDTSGIVTNAVNQLQIGSRTGVAEFANAPIRKIAYYPMRLTNAQLQALTS